LGKIITLDSASKLLGVCKETLRRMDRKGELKAITTNGGHRRYDEDEVLKYRDGKIKQTEVTHLKDSVTLYVRVSSHDQKKNGDLDRQKARLLDYATNKGYIIQFVREEVASGVNDNRRQLRYAINDIIQKNSTIILVENKDRLSRFGFNYLKMLVESHNGRIEFVNEPELNDDFYGDLVQDLVAIMASFSAKIYGKRSKINRENAKTKGLNTTHTTKLHNDKQNNKSSKGINKKL
jgi:excisionase family DNA binding protein